MEAAGLLAQAFEPVAAVFEQPGLLPAVLRAAGGAASTLSAAWWLDNQTGAELELWVATPAEARDRQLLKGGGSQASGHVKALPLSCTKLSQGVVQRGAVTSPGRLLCFPRAGTTWQRLRLIALPPCAAAPFRVRV